MDDVFDALQAELDEIAAMLRSLDDASWDRPSLCPGWTVADVVLHLAQTEEAVVASAGLGTTERQATEGATIDDVAERMMAEERGRQSPSELLERWDTARRTSFTTLRDADPEQRVAWATIPLKPRTLATTRLSEHWIHANDIAEPLSLDHPDTDRLWHIARLAHRTIPYAYQRDGRGEPPSVFLELAAPSGERWTFGPDDAGVRVSATASEFCRIAARRLDPSEAATIVATGDRAAEVLGLVRTYA